MTSIDLNCDLGEGFGVYTLGNDAELMPLITSANIACGFHASNPLLMARSVLLAKVLSRLPGSPINPLIGAAGVSAVPMAARVVQVVGQEADPNNYLLMHAMGPNVAGVIGTAIAAGALLSVLG